VDLSSSVVFHFVFVFYSFNESAFCIMAQWTLGCTEYVLAIAWMVGFSCTLLYFINFAQCTLATSVKHRYWPTHRYRHLGRSGHRYTYRYRYNWLRCARKWLQSVRMVVSGSVWFGLKSERAGRDGMGLGMGIATMKCPRWPSVIFAAIKKRWRCGPRWFT